MSGTAAAPTFISEDTIMLSYKVVEIGTVTEDAIEEVLNSWCSKGWNFDGIQFAMRESSKRPAMAFALFTRKTSCGDQ
jgi:hypothetical protein